MLLKATLKSQLEEIPHMCVHPYVVFHKILSLVLVEKNEDAIRLALKAFSNLRCEPCLG
jgi:hypothetical protein